MRIVHNHHEGNFLHTLFKDLPPTLKQDVHYYCCRPFLDELRCLDTLPVWFKRYLSLFIRGEIYLQEDRMIKLNDVTSKCYYLQAEGEGLLWEENGEKFTVEPLQVGVRRKENGQRAYMLTKTHPKRRHSFG